MTDVVERLYDKNRRPMELEPWYSKHVSAMTGEGLHSKADIAKELAYRDQQIESLRQQLAECQAVNKVLRDTIDAEVQYQHEKYDRYAAELDEALDMPSDSTALDEAIRKAKRDALLEAADHFDFLSSTDGLMGGARLRSMAKELE
jgi:hypothetical protein